MKVSLTLELREDRQEDLDCGILSGRCFVEVRQDNHQQIQLRVVGREAHVPRDLAVVTDEVGGKPRKAQSVAAPLGFAWVGRSDAVESELLRLRVEEPAADELFVYSAMSSAVEMADPAVHPGDGFQSVTSLGLKVPACAAAFWSGVSAMLSRVDLSVRYM